MRKTFIIGIFLLATVFFFRANFSVIHRTEEVPSYQERASAEIREITGSVRKGETLFDIFRRYELDLSDFFSMRESSAAVHRLRDLAPDRRYTITLDANDKVNSFLYWIDDDTLLSIERTESGFNAEKVPVAYERRIMHLGGIIEDNLISSVGEGRNNVLIALQLSDIFAWDIDFTSDLRKKDVFKIVVEGLYLDGEFKKFGNILAAEFLNNGERYSAYRFEVDGKPDYYAADGSSLRKAFLKAPLSFRRISSHFSRGRFHPVLKIYRPHHGLDYAAPAGTPVSASGDGTVVFAGRKGQYGKLVVLRHRNGYKTYYGHLSRMGKGIRGGAKVDQGAVIGYVGATGLATGPHLHYEMRLNNRPVNPLSVKVPRGTAIPKGLMADFGRVAGSMERELASISAENHGVSAGPKGLAPAGGRG